MDLDLALTHGGLNTGPLGMSCGVWHQGVGSVLQRGGGAATERMGSGTYHGYLIGFGFGIGEFSREHLEFFVTFFWPFLS